MSSISPEGNVLNGADLSALIHELRQPLGSIEASTSLLRLVLGPEDDARVTESLDLIERQVEAMHRILLGVAGR